MGSRRVRPLLAATLLLVATTSAHAADRYAMTCVVNKIDIPINYSVRWGDSGDWKAFTVSPGKKTWHTWEYPRGKEGRSPYLHIRFDDDLSKRMKLRSYKLESFRSPQQGDCARYGKEYSFVYDGSAAKHIDLVGKR